MLLAVPHQANYKSWMNDSWEKLDGEQVENSVSSALKVRGGRAMQCGGMLMKRGGGEKAADEGRMGGRGEG